MNSLRLLIVEDSEQDLSICKDSVNRYLDEKQRHIDIIECRNITEAFQKLDNSFDGAIIDLKLAGVGDEGNQIIKRIVDSHYRIPIVIFTGTPDNADLEFNYIGVYKKGEKEYIDFFDRFWSIYNTGLTRIMGGRGKIEETLNKVFLNNLIPQINTWIDYGTMNSDRTEKALLRYTLNHLIQLIDDEDRCFPDEVYLYPPMNENIRTGSIVKNISSDLQYAVMNPACDLVIRDDGNSNTDIILLIEIETQKAIFPSLPDSNLSFTQKKELEKAYQNKKKTYHHWLPKTSYFKGGFLNFRKIITINKDKFYEEFEIPTVQISPSFIKDIISRFSSYYARQGQPDIDFKNIMAE